MQIEYIKLGGGARRHGRCWDWERTLRLSDSVDNRITARPNGTTGGFLSYGRRLGVSCDLASLPSASLSPPRNHRLHRHRCASALPKVSSLLASHHTPRPLEFPCWKPHFLRRQEQSLLLRHDGFLDLSDDERHLSQIKQIFTSSITLIISRFKGSEDHTNLMFLM